jgi:hypothetical protein
LIKWVLTGGSVRRRYRKRSLIRRLHLFNQRVPLIAAILFAAASPAIADSDLATQATPPERISFLVIFGDDKCPEAVGDEIVVCAPAPESDRYRIPKKLRDTEEAMPVRFCRTAARSMDRTALLAAPRPRLNSGTPNDGANATRIDGGWLARPDPAPF